MNIMTFSMKWKTGQYRFAIDRRLNFIVGDSATGKTSIGHFLDIYYNSNKGRIELDSPLPLIWFKSTRDFDIVNEYKNSIILIDEFLIAKYNVLLPLIDISIRNNLYIIVICRYDEPRVSGIDYALSAIKELVTYNSVTYCKERYYIEAPINVTFDYIFTEDSKAGLKFFQKINPKVMTTNGNSNIRTVLKEYTGNILVIADMACLGRHYRRINNLNDGKRKIYLVPEYECFEELLLRSNFFKDDIKVCNMFQNIFEYANNYKTWEQFFEVFISAQTFGIPIAISHKRGLRDCYTEPCGDNLSCSPQRFEDCLLALPGFDKPYELLKGTKYEYLYHILKNN